MITLRRNDGKELSMAISKEELINLAQYILEITRLYNDEENKNRI